MTAEQDGDFEEDSSSLSKVEITEEKENTFSQATAWAMDTNSSSSKKSGGGSVWRRSYTWNENNMLKVSADSDYTVNYTYGSDGQRAVKSSSAGETLYFNKMFSWSYNTSVYSNGARAVKHIYVNDQRIVTKMCKASDPSASEMREYEYFYHTDHLGSASLVTTGEGELYERIEYTPWGETWMDKTTASWETPYKFTGKEKDEETGLYYYGARYYDAKYSRWLSADPALGEYIPKAGNDQSGGEKLPGMGGLFNHTNLNLYHYAGNNPVKYVDPDGKEDKKTRVAELTSWQSAVIADPDLKQGAGGPFKRTNVTQNTTWCNQATFKVAKNTSPELAKSMYNKNDNGNNTNANSAADNLKVNASDPKQMIIEISPKFAQALANAGFTVGAAKKVEDGIGHLATVAPGFDFDEKKGPMMANVGGADKQGLKRAASAFRGTNYADGNVKFYFSLKDAFIKLISGGKNENQ